MLFKKFFNNKVKEIRFTSWSVVTTHQRQKIQHISQLTGTVQSPILIQSSFQTEMSPGLIVRTALAQFQISHDVAHNSF